MTSHCVVTTFFPFSILLFFAQGDLEKELGLAYSPLCDRNSTLIPQSQIGTYALPLMMIINLATKCTIITNTFFFPFHYCTVTAVFVDSIIPVLLLGFIDFIVAPTMELCGDLIERVHEHISASAVAAAAEVAADDQVAELAAQNKSQARSQSSTDSTTTVKANGSSGPQSSANSSSSRYDSYHSATSFCLSAKLAAAAFYAQLSFYFANLTFFLCLIPY